MRKSEWSLYVMSGSERHLVDGHKNDILLTLLSEMLLVIFNSLKQRKVHIISGQFPECTVSTTILNLHYKS